MLYIYRNYMLGHKIWSHIHDVVSSYICLPHVRCMLPRDWSVIMLARRWRHCLSSHSRSRGFIYLMPWNLEECNWSVGVVISLWLVDCSGRSANLIVTFNANHNHNSNCKPNPYFGNNTDWCYSIHTASLVLFLAVNIRIPVYNGTQNVQFYAVHFNIILGYVHFACSINHV